MFDEEKRNTIGATVFALLAGIATLCFATWYILGKEIDSSPKIKNPKDIAVIETVSANNKKAPVEESAPKEQIKMRLDQRSDFSQTRREAMEKSKIATQELERLKARYGFQNTKVSDPLPQKKDRSAEAKAEFLALKDEAQEVAAKQNKLIDELKAQIGNLETESKQKLEDAIKASEKLATELQDSVNTKSELEDKVSNLVIEKDKLESMVQTLTQAQTDLKTKLVATNKTAEKAQASINESNTKVKALALQLENLRKKLNANSKSWAAEKATLTAEAEKLNKSTEALLNEKTKLIADVSKKDKTITQLQTELTALAKKAPLPSVAPAAPSLHLPLLVDTPTQLAPYAKPLFSKLNDIDDSVSAREQAYAELAKADEYDPKLKVLFSSGQADVASSYDEAISKLTDESNSKFLVVGYASTDGTTEGNRKLSSQRASNVAQKIAEKLGDDGKKRVQAIYFGQTKRFDQGKKSPNRVVEVWRIK